MSPLSQDGATAMLIGILASCYPELREQYGRRLRLWGGVDKMIFLKDKAAVDAELERLRPVVEQGGFIPTVDHRVQEDASLALYQRYLDGKRELFHVGGEPKY